MQAQALQQVAHADDDVLTPADVYRLYQIKPTTQASLRYRRLIPFYSIGGRIVRYKRSELEAWLAAGARPANGDLPTTRRRYRRKAQPAPQTATRDPQE